MPKQRVQASALDNFTRQHLGSEGYKVLNPPKPSGAGGADIVAEKGGERIYIEVIGYKEKGPARANDFFRVFWQAISRLNASEVRRIIIVLDQQAKQGLPARIDQHRVGWGRIGEAFPELEIWFADIKAGTVEKYRWSECLSLA